MPSNHARHSDVEPGYWWSCQASHTACHFNNHLASFQMWIPPITLLAKHLALGYRLLIVTIILVWHSKPGVSVNGIDSIPAAIRNYVGTSNTMLRHNVVWTATTKPSNCNKADIGRNWSIWGVTCSTFLTRWSNPWDMDTGCWLLQDSWKICSNSFDMMSS